MSEEPLQEGWLSEVRGGALGYGERVTCGFLIASALSFFLFVGGLSRFSVQYQTNDDAGMNMFAAGKGLAQQPSEFLLFQHFIIGLALKFLYTHHPEIPWYGALMYAYLFLSSLVIGYAILRLNPHSSVVGLWIVTLVLFYLPVIVSPQFTICSGYLGIAGILLLYSTLYKPHDSKTANLCLLTLASGLLILAGLIRFHGLLLVLLLMAPLYVNVLVNRFPMALRRMLPILCCVVFISVLLNWGQHTYYERSPGWERFYSYNDLRADFIDRPKITWNESTQPLFQQIGWSQNDLAMMQNWFYLDPKVYSFQNLLFMSQNTPSLLQHKVVWGKLFDGLRRSFSSYGGIAALLLCVLLLTKGVRITQSFAVLALVWYSSLFAGISIVERNPPLRVWLVMLFGLYVMELVLWCQVCERRPVGQSANTKQRLSNGILCFLGVALYTVCCWGVVKAVSEQSYAQQLAQKSLRDDLARLQPRADQLFVIWGRAFPYEGFQLPTQAEPVASEMQLLGLGVGNHEPFVQNRLRTFGIDDLYQSFYTREDVFLIGTERINRLLVQYIQEHYQTRVEVRTVFQGMTFTVSKVRKLI